MSDTPRKTKAHGHIVQADWNQTDPLQMDYIHNKPEIPVLPSLDNFVDKSYVDTEINKVYKKELINADLSGHTEIVSLSSLTPVNDLYMCVSVTVPQNTDVTFKFVNGKDPASLGISSAENQSEYDNAGYTGFSCPCERISIKATETGHDSIDEASLGYLVANYHAEAEWHNINEEVTINSGESTNLYIRLSEDQLSIQDTAAFIAKYSGVEIEASYGVNINSDTEYVCAEPFTNIHIVNFIKSYPETVAQEWTISFLTDEESPSITVPNTIKWLYAEPIFEANHRYLVTFKQIHNNIYGIWTVLE